MIAFSYAILQEFLSTPSARRATTVIDDTDDLPFYFYPRPPRGGRHPDRHRRHRGRVHFYPRPPRGGRHSTGLEWLYTYKFLSTPSARRATTTSSGKSPKRWISIHALREEGDLFVLDVPGAGAVFLSTPSARRATQALTKAGYSPRNFYPRPPRGGRPFLAR